MISTRSQGLKRAIFSVKLKSESCPYFVYSNHKNQCFCETHGAKCRHATTVLSHYDLSIVSNPVIHDKEHGDEEIEDDHDDSDSDADVDNGDV